MFRRKLRIQCSEVATLLGTQWKDLGNIGGLYRSEQHNGRNPPVNG